MSKMNWDRVRWENRAVRQGSEWASSDGAPPLFSGPGRCAPTSTHPSIPIARNSKKKKKKKKHKVAQRSVQLQPKEKVAANSKPNVSAGTMTQVLPKTSDSLKSPFLSGVSQVKRAERAPVFPLKAKSNGLKIQHAGDPLSVPELQKLTIRLYKALAENRMLEAASLATDIHNESLHYADHANRERIVNKYQCNEED